MNKKILHTLLAIFLLMGISYQAMAQVTIGSSEKPSTFSVLELDNRTKITDKGGLRLPHLTTADRKTLSEEQTFTKQQHREDLPNKKAGLALGLTIYNTDVNCIEYWDGYKWVSLCLGSASIEISNYPQPSIAPGGGETDPMTPIEDPKCADNPPYSVAVAVGAAYANAYIIEQSTGEFRVYMNDNPTAKDRIAIVRLTNNCTGEYKEFIFNQEGNIDLCDKLAVSDKPVLTASNGGVICGEMGNSIILGVTNPALNADGTTPATYIWMRNDNEEIGRGKSITVSQAGSYKVYAGGIGCGGNDFSESILVTVNKTGTPPSEITIMADNGAIVCGGTAVNLTVKDFVASMSVIWYKDGVQYGTGKNVSTTTDGNFVAVVSQGGCTSNPSNDINIKVQAGSPISFTKADIEINGKTLDQGNPSFCSGGWLNMKIVTNPLPAGYVYKWIVNGVQVGTGTSCNYQLPGSIGSDVYISIVAESGAANSCPTAITIGSTMSVNEPLNAAITGSKIFCNNVPGGVLLNTAGGGATYIWKNLVTNATSSTGANNYFGATVGGRYEVEITTTAGCKSVTQVPHEVEMIGSPALTWAGGVLASIVGENENVTFMVKNVGSPATQGYTWSATTKSGNAAATIAAGATETAQITFTGGGVVTLTIVGKGYCGSSAPLTVDVTVNQDRPDIPVQVTPPSIDVCEGWNFSIAEGTTSTPGTLKYYKDRYGTDFIIKWYSVQGVGNSIGIGTQRTSGLHGEFCYIPFSQNGAKAVMTATCTAGGRESDVSLASIVTGGIGAVQTYNLKGQACFDVKQTLYPTNDCGVWDQRTEANFGISHEYELTGTLLPTNATQLTWSFTDPGNLVESYDFTTVNKAFIKIKDVKQYPTIKGSTIGESFTLHVSFEVMNNGCLSTYSKSIVINIRDCDCCGSVTDIVGNTYTAAKFGEAGCWMTENLATTSKPNNIALTITSAVPGGAANATKAKPKTSGGEGWGRHYDWTVTMNGETFETITTQVSKGKSTVQGICPEGWLLPSDYDWNQLEKEIATNPTPYSTNTKVWVWNTNWEKGKTAPGYGWRPDGTNTAGGWGESMKSSRVVAGLTNAAGKSNLKEKGFDALMVGSSGGINPSSYYWSSSAMSSIASWVRYVASNMKEGGRSYYTNNFQFSVRCKKKD